MGMPNLSSGSYFMRLTCDAVSNKGSGYSRWGSNPRRPEYQPTHCSKRLAVVHPWTKHPSLAVSGIWALSQARPQHNACVIDNTLPVKLRSVEERSKVQGWKTCRHSRCRPVKACNYFRWLR